jgi:hypothetical protein
MDGRPEHAAARRALRGLLQGTRVGVVVVPADRRDDLGMEALIGLEKIIRTNELTASGHDVYFDQGIIVKPDLAGSFDRRVSVQCEVFLNSDSRSVGGLQVAEQI